MTAFVNDNGIWDLVSRTAFGDSAGYNFAAALGWGGGSGQAVTDALLADEFAELRVATTVSQITTNVPNDTLRVQGSITALAPRTVTEVGAFATDTPGEASLDIYADFAAITLNAGDNINFTIDMVVQRA